ncbi:MAG: hypothetical protein KBD78_15705 [Oligoflexales bacterium]|nr:hypothetical protein [Oligoflexales bacterium]
MSKQFNLALAALLFFAFCIPEFALASVESTLEAIQSKLVNVILPLVAILGLVFSAFSFITGNPNAKAHLFLAIVGCAVGFGAQSIVNFVRDLVN